MCKAWIVLLTFRLLANMPRALLLSLAARMGIGGDTAGHRLLDSVGKRP